MISLRRIHKSLAALVLMAGFATAATASIPTPTTVFSDDFSGAGGLLNGTTPDVTTAAEVWEAGDTWLDNGTALSPIAGGPDGQAAHLNYVPLDGRMYSAKATILNPQPNWVAFGFLPATPAGGDWTVQDFSVRHSNAPGYGWMLTRNSSGNDQEGFLGGGTAGGQPWSGDVVDPNNPVDIMIVLDTTGANWTVEWFINGSSMGAPVAFAAAGNPGIGGIGFSHDRNSTTNNGAVISNFSLTYIPEPVSAALFGFVGAGLVVRRRR